MYSASTGRFGFVMLYPLLLFSVFDVFAIFVTVNDEYTLHTVFKWTVSTC